MQKRTDRRFAEPTREEGLPCAVSEAGLLWNTNKGYTKRIMNGTISIFCNLKKP